MEEELPHVLTSQPLKRQEKPPTLSEEEKGLSKGGVTWKFAEEFKSELLSGGKRASPLITAVRFWFGGRGLFKKRSIKRCEKKSAPMKKKKKGSTIEDRIAEKKKSIKLGAKC